MDASSVVYALIPSGKLANQIEALLSIVKFGLELCR